MKMDGLIKTLWHKTIIILGGIVVVMTFIDFLLKWKIYSYIYDIISMLISILSKFTFESFVLLCLATLAISFWKIHRHVLNSKPSALEKKIADTKTLLENQIEKLSDSATIQIKNVEKKLDDEIFDIKRTIVDFEIENHKNKGQVGAISKMIDKLQMDVKKGWGYENTLLEIREYIKQNGMPNYFLDDLHKALKEIPDSVKKIGEEIIELAQQKLYNPNS